MRRKLLGAMTVAVLVGASLSVASPAQAATDGNCGLGEVCFYWLPNRTSYIYDTGSDTNNFAGKFFYNSGSVPLNDNSESVWCHTAFSWCDIFQDANCAHLRGKVRLELGIRLGHDRPLPSSPG